MQKNKKGLTLIELVISLALFGLVLQVVYSLFFVGNNSFVVNTNKGFTQQEARLLGDIINSELKYITNMTTDPTVVEEHFLGSYYSLEFDTDGELPVLLWKFYEYNGVDYNITEKRIPGTAARYKEFRISNQEEGIISILIDHELTKGKLKTSYKLPFNIHLLNNTSLATAEDVDLVDAGNVLYYTKAQDMLLGKQIDIPDVPPGGDDDEYPEITPSPEPTASPGPTASPAPTPSPEPTPMPVTVQVKAGNIMSINDKTPSTDNGRYKIKKANDGDGKNLIKIQLNNYINEMHKGGKVTVTATAPQGTITDSIVLNEQTGVVSFYLRATENGSKKEVEVSLVIKTVMETGTEQDSKVYHFITS